VCLGVPHLDDLVRCHLKAQELGLPTVLIEDTGNNTCFNGVPTITAVGIGPCTKLQAMFLKKFQLLN
jgi:peptidyl-tRNA hydrolase